MLCKFWSVSLVDRSSRFFVLYTDFSLRVKCGSSLYLPKIGQSVVNTYESSDSYQPLLKNKC